MSETLKQTVVRPFLLICFLAGVAQAFVRVGDKVVMQHHIQSNDVILKSSAYIIVGAWIGVIIGFLIFAPFLGKHLDRKYTGILLQNKSMHTSALGSGFLAAVGTFLGFLAIDQISPGVTAAMLSITVFWTIVFDRRKGQLLSQKFLGIAFLGVAGLILILISSSPIKTGALVLAMYFAITFIYAGSEMFEQNGARASDAVNFHLWRMFYLASFGTILAIMFSLYRKNLSQLLDLIQNMIFGWGGFWALLVMFFAFLGFSLYFEIKARVGQAVSPAFLVQLQVMIVLSTLITFVGDYFSPNIFGELQIPEYGIYGWVTGIILLGISVWKMKTNGWLNT
jgi:drug/metabolite transporter (DMT)-like permease